MCPLPVMVVALLCLGAAGEPESVAVIPLAAKRVPKETVAVLDDLLLTSIGQSGKYRPLGPSDINAMLGMEKMKELLGCNDVSCAAEIGGALGVRTLVTGTVSKLGSSVIVTLSLIDAQAHAVKRRSKAQVKDDENLYPQAIDVAVCQLLDLQPDCVAAAASGAGNTAAPTAAAPAAASTTTDRGYQQFQNGRLAKNEPGRHWVDAVADCLEARKKYDRIVNVTCKFDGKPLGYELFFDGALAGYEPGWDLQKAQSNCAWNVSAHKEIRVDCHFEGSSILPSDAPSASIKTCAVETKGGMTVTGAWKDVANTADWKLQSGCIWRIWEGRPFTVIWMANDTTAGVVVEVDQFPLSDDLGKWSQAFMEVNGKRFPLGAASAGVTTFRLDITSVASKGQNTLNLYSTDGTNLLHGIQAIRIVSRP